MSTKDLQSKTEKVLQHAQVILRPLVAWLLRSGVTYTTLVGAIKIVFLEQAEQELHRQQQKCNDSSMSTASGLNRKIVKELWRETQNLNQRASALGRPSLASRVMTRWLEGVQDDGPPDLGTAPHMPQRHRYLYANRIPYAVADSVLVDHSFGGSFESLVYEVSVDVRPRSVLNELLRLNLARVEVIDEQEIVVRESSDFLPATTSDESLDMFSGAISDHLWAGVNNISLMNKPELERSIFASNMSQQSIDELSSFAQKEWQRIFPRVVNKARQLYDDDVSNNRGGYRMRIGMYFHGEEDCKNIENPVSDQDSDK